MPTIIRFDDLAANTPVSNQFQDKGIIFREGTTSDNPGAPSARNILRAVDLLHEVGGDTPARVGGVFTDPDHAQIGVFVVLRPESVSGGSARLTAFNNINAEIASIRIDVPAGQLAQFGEIFSPEKNIASFSVDGFHSETNGFVGIDNVTFDTVPDPCQAIVDAVTALEEQIENLEEGLHNGEIPLPPRTPEAIAKVRNFIGQLQGKLNRERVVLMRCRAANP
jgi:hypothetical protein